jgi:hypothetical protein
MSALRGLIVLGRLASQDADAAYRVDIVFEPLITTVAVSGALETSCCASLVSAVEAACQRQPACVRVDVTALDPTSDAVRVALARAHAIAKDVNVHFDVVGAEWSSRSSRRVTGQG